MEILIRLLLLYVFLCFLYEYYFTLSFMYICKFLISACVNFIISAFKNKTNYLLLVVINNHSIWRLVVSSQIAIDNQLSIAKSLLTTGCQ